MSEENATENARADRASAPALGSAMEFRIGDRSYWIGRDDRRHGYHIVSNGDLVDYASALHYGEIGAFRLMAKRLGQIEDLWARTPNYACHR